MAPKKITQPKAKSKVTAAEELTPPAAAQRASAGVDLKGLPSTLQHESTTQTFRLFVLVGERLREGDFSMVFGSSHTGWASPIELHTCGDALLDGHAFTQDIRMPPDGNLEFKIGLFGPFWTWGGPGVYWEPRKSHQRHGNVHGNRLVRVPDSRIVVAYVPQSEQLNYGRNCVEFSDMCYLAPLVLRSHACTFAEWDHIIVALNEALGFGRHVRTPPQEFPALLVSAFEQIISEEGSGAALLWLLRFQSPLALWTMGLPAGASFVCALTEHGQALKGALEAVKPVLEKSASAVSALSEHLRELQQMVLDAALDKDHVEYLAHAWLLLMTARDLSHEALNICVTDFLKKPGVKRALERNCGPMIQMLVRLELPLGELVPLVSMGPGGFRDVQVLVTELEAACPNERERLVQPLVEWTKHRIARPESWQYTQQETGRPKVGDRVVVKRTGKAGIVKKDDGSTNLPLQLVIDARLSWYNIEELQLEAVAQVLEPRILWGELLVLVDEFLPQCPHFFLQSPGLLLACMEAAQWQVKGEVELAFALKVLVPLFGCVVRLEGHEAWTSEQVRQSEALVGHLAEWVGKLVESELGWSVYGVLLSVANQAQMAPAWIHSFAATIVNKLPSGVFLSEDMDAFFDVLQRVEPVLVEAIIQQARRSIDWSIGHFRERLEVYVEPLFKLWPPEVMEFCRSLAQEILQALQTAKTAPVGDDLVPDARCAVNFPDVWRYLFDVADRMHSADMQSNAPALLSEVARVRQAITDLVGHLSGGTVLLHKFRRSAQHLHQLVQLTRQQHLPRDVETLVQRVQQTEAEERSMDRFLHACAPCSSVLRTHVVGLQKPLREWVARRESEVNVCDWKPLPAAHEGHADMEFAVMALGSKVCQQLWTAIGEEDVEGELASPATLISPMCAKLKDDLGRLMQGFDSGQLKNVSLRPFMHALVEGMPMPKHPERDMNPEAAKDFMREQSTAARLFVQKRADAELRTILGEIVPAVGGQLKPREQLVHTLCQCFDMWHARSKVQALGLLLDEPSLKETLEPSLIEGSRALGCFLSQAKTFEEDTMDVCLAAYRTLWKTVPAVQELSEDMLIELRRAVVKGLVAELSHSESNVDFLSFRDRFLAQASLGIEEDVMLSFQRVREVFAGILYTSRHGKPATLQDLLLELNSLCVPDLSILADRLEVITTVRVNTGTMEGVTALENTVHLLRQGLFVVCLQPHLAVAVTASLAADASIGQQGDINLSQSELLERRNQIMMAEIPVEVASSAADEQPETHSGVVDLDAFLADVHLGSVTGQLLHDPALRAQVVQRFATVVSLLLEISEELTMLREMGHINFQEGQLKTSGRLEELQAHLHALRAAKQEWKNLQVAMKEVQPLLQLLLPKQQVHLLRAMPKVLAGDAEAIVSLGSILCNIHRVTPEVVSKVLRHLPVSTTTNDLVDIMVGPGNSLIRELLGDHLSDHLNARMPKGRGMPEKLVNRGLPLLGRLVQALDGLWGMTTLKSAPLSVLCTYGSADGLQMSSNRVPELILLLYYLQFQRLPTPFEVMLCTASTSDHNLLAFLGRWKSSASFANRFRASGQTGPPLLFCLANVQKLPYPRQALLCAELRRAEEEHPEGAPQVPLAVLLCAPERSSRASALANLGSCLSLVGALLAPGPGDAIVHRIMEVHLRPLVRVYSSSEPCSGKTRQIRQQAGAAGLLYCVVRVTKDLTSICEQLRKVQADRRRVAPARGLALHINVAHDADFSGFNDFLLSLLFFRCWDDSEGAPHVWQDEVDKVFIEIPSEGPGGRVVLDRLPLLRALDTVAPTTGICVVEPQLQPLEGSEFLHEICLVPDRSMEAAVAWLDAFIRCKPTRAWPDLLPMPADADPKSIDVDGLIHRIMEDEDNGIRERHGSQSSFRLFQKIRLLKFLGPQFLKLGERDSDAGLSAAPPDELVMFRMLRWLYVQVIVRTSASVAVSAVGPIPDCAPGATAMRDHVLRFEAMTTFERSVNDFVVVSDGAVDIISLRRQNLMTSLLQRYPSNTPHLNEFRQYLVMNGLDKPPNPVRDLRQTLMGVDKSRDRIWKLFWVKKPLSLRHYLQLFETSRQRGETQKEEEAIQDAKEVLQKMEVPGQSPAVDNLKNPLDIFATGQKMIEFYQQPHYTVTPENLIRLLHIHYRLSAGIPVLVLGETGCGKTQAIRFLTRMLGCAFFIINVHGGMTSQDIWNELAPAVAAARADGEQWVYVFMDESNTMPDTWAIKECVCDGVCEGRALPRNLCVISAINPTRLKKEVSGAGIKAGLEGGVDAHAYYEQLQRHEAGSSIHDSFAREGNLLTSSFHEIVYPVFPVPESILSLMWDFGNPCNNIWLGEGKLAGSEMAQQAIPNARTVFLDPVSDEKIQIEAMVNRMIEHGYTREDCPSQGFDALKMWLQVEFESNRLSTAAHWQAIRTIIMECIAEAQRFIRDEVHQRDSSSVSLRDISRCVQLVPWLLGLFEKRRLAEEKMPALRRPIGLARLPRCQQLRDAVVIAITHCYAMRLNLRKEEFREVICRHWDRARRAGFDNDFFPVPEGDEFWAPYKDISGFIVDQLHFEVGIARNDAIRENTFALFVAMCTGTATFIVGKPGTSKSLSLDMLAGMMLNREHPFWRQFPVVHKKVFQCDPLVTPQSILSAAAQIGRLQVKQKRHSAEEHVGVLVLEEVGVTALSPHNPLMSLHALIDRGVEVDGQFVNICIIGISNWRVDPAKTNRATFIFRGDPSPEDLQMTGRQIILGTAVKAVGTGRCAASGSNLEQLSSVLSALASIVSNTIIRDPRYSYYYGLRDYYGTVKFLQTELSRAATDELMPGAAPSVAAITSHVVKWALARNLSTLPPDTAQAEPGRFQRDLEEALERALVGADRNREQPAEWHVDWLQEPQRLCTSCARAAQHFARRVGRDAVRCRLLERRERLERHACQCPSPFPVLRQVAWNLGDRDARYLMVITEGSQALPLLFTTGLARFEATTVIFGSEFQEDIGDTATLRHLQRVQASMRLGQLLVLVHCRRIYENLLDMTNQHHLEEHGRRYARLSMQAHSRYFPVHDSFRCVILVERDEVRALPPPFLNRFEKAVLTYDTVLEASHREDFGRLQARLTARGAGCDLNLWAKLLPGHSTETLQSLAFACAESSECGEERTRHALFRAVQAARFTEMLHLRCSSCAEVVEASKDAAFSYVLNELFFFYFVGQRHGSVKSVLEHARQRHVRRGEHEEAEEQEGEREADDGAGDTAQLDKTCPWGDDLGLHLVFLTEQHPSRWSGEALERDLRGPRVVVKVLPLDQISSESNITSSLRLFYAQTAEQQLQEVDDSYLVVLVPSHLSPALLRKTLFLCSDERRKFLNESATGEADAKGAQRRSIRRHVLLILNTLNTTSTLHFDEHWHYIFVDCVCSTTIAGLGDASLSDFIDRPLLRVGSGEDEEEKPLLAPGQGTSVLSIPRILCANLHVIVSSLKYAHEDWTGDPGGLAMSGRQRAAQFSEILQKEESPPVRALVGRLVAELQRNESWADGEWLTEAMKRLDVSGSCFETFAQFLADGLVAIFKQMLTIADLHDNLRLAANPDLQQLWAELFQSPFVSGSPGAGPLMRSVGQSPAAYMTVIGQSHARWPASRLAPQNNELPRITEGVEDLHYPPGYRVCFPFGSLICQRLWNLRQQPGYLHELLIRGCPTLATLDVGSVRGAPQLELLATDALAGAFPDAALGEIEVLLLFCRLSGALEDCVSLFQFLWAHDRLLARLHTLVVSIGVDGLEDVASKLKGVAPPVDKNGGSSTETERESVEEIPTPGVLLLLHVLRVAVACVATRTVDPAATPASLRELLRRFLVLYNSVECPVKMVASQGKEEQADSILQQVEVLWAGIKRGHTFLHYAVVLRTHFLSEGQEMAISHLRLLQDKFKAEAMVVEEEFLCFLRDIIGQGVTQEAADAASKCIVPALHALRGPEWSESSAAGALSLLTGRHELFQQATELQLVWLPQAKSQNTTDNLVRISYSSASTLASWFLQFFEHCLENDRSAMDRMGVASNEALGAFGGECGPLASLMAQTWADRLEVQLIADRLQLLTSPPVLLRAGAAQPDLMPRGNLGDASLSLRRVLVVGTLKFLLQISADLLLGAGDASSVSALEQVAPLLEDLVSQLKPTTEGQLAGTLTCDAGDISEQLSHVSPVVSAVALLPRASHLHMVHLFLRQLSKSGVEQAAAIRALQLDAKREDAQRVFPRAFYTFEPVRRFGTPVNAVAPSPMSLHAGYAAVARALQLAVSDNMEDALCILRGQVSAHVMPREDQQQRAALAVAMMERALVAEVAERETLLRVLDRVSWMERERPVTDLIRRVLDPSSHIPEALRRHLWDEQNGQLSCLVFHVLTLLVLDNGASQFLAVFREALAGGAAALARSQLIANPDSEWHRYLRMFPAGHWVYSCPNRHMYVTDGCQNIRNQGTCSCGAVIGGPKYGVNHTGNIRHGTIAEVVARWDDHFSRFFANQLGFHAECRDAARTERRLSPAMFRCLRFALEASMVGYGLLHSTEEIGGDLTVPQVFEQLSIEVGSLKDGLFTRSADEVPVYLYLHSVLAALLGSPPANPGSWPLPDKVACAAVEDAVIAHTIGSDPPVFAEQPTQVVRRVQNTMDAAQTSASYDETLEAVKRTPQFLKSCARDAVEGLEAPCAGHWVPSPLLSLDALWTVADAAPDRIAVLQLLRRREASLAPRATENDFMPPNLALLRHLPAVVAFMKLLFVHFNMKVNRVDAETTLTLRRAIAQLEEESPAAARQIQAAVPAFQEALRETWPHVHRHPLNPCIDYDDPASPAHPLRTLHQEPVEDMLLGKLLVCDEGPMQALFGSLSAWQRDFVLDPALRQLETRLGHERAIPSLEARPFACSLSDVVSFDSRRDLWPRLANFVVRSLDAETMDTIEFDNLEGLEMEVVELTRILQKPVLPERLPPVQYLDEMTQAAVLSTLDERVGLVQQLLLPPAAAAAIRALSVQEPASREMLRSYALFLAALAVQINQRMDQTIVDFVNGCASPLLGSRQRRANAVLRRVPQLDGLLLSHLRALAAACWDGQVHSQFARDPNPAEVVALKEALDCVSKQAKSIPSLLHAALRRVGSEEYSYGRGWPDFITNADGAKVPNPRLVCPGGSFKYSAIEPVLMTEWDEVPEAFERIPITCFQAVFQALESLVAGEDSAKSLGLEASVAWGAEPRGGATADNDTAWSDNDLDDWEMPELERGHSAGAGEVPPPARLVEAAAPPVRPQLLPACTGWSPVGATFELSSSIDSGVVATRQLEETLRQHGRKLVLTPLDGSCLFHALQLTRSGGSVLTIDELRQQALSQVQPEQLSVVAADRGMTVEEFSKRMMQRGAWGNESTVGLLALSQQMAITVVSPTFTRTWTVAGKELPGNLEDSRWIAYDGRNHFFGTTSF